MFEKTAKTVVYVIVHGEKKEEPKEEEEEVKCCLFRIYKKCNR